jgi:hypothetical protein
MKVFFHLAGDPWIQHDQEMVQAPRVGEYVFLGRLGWMRVELVEWTPGADGADVEVWGIPDPNHTKARTAVRAAAANAD